MTIESKDLGKRLRQARKDVRLTQQAVADRAGVTRATLVRLEQGRNVGLVDVCSVAQALGFRLVLEQVVRPTWEDAPEFFREDDDDA